jgi:DNA-binding GntR family transcriptional regulator
MLERDGLVMLTPSRGVEVVPLGQIDLVSAYEVREVIDGLAASLTALRCQPDLEIQLHRQIEFQHEALAPWNPRLWIRLNLAFHSLILEQAGNPYLDPYLVLMRLTAQIFFPQHLLDPIHAASALQEHERICDAICARDPDRAEAMARDHMHRTVLALRPATPLPVATLT